MTSSSSTQSSSPPLNVEKLQAPMFDTHKSGINRSYEWRRAQLLTLHKMIVERQEIFVDALCLDLGRDRTEALCCDVLPVHSEIQYMLDHLKGWMRPEYVPIPAVLFPASARIEREPLHAPGVLIIGPSNYPLHLCLRPLAGVLAGGNPCVVKPSELTPHTAKAIADAIADYFDPSAVQVVLGGVPETTALLSKPWSKVLFTGSERVGRIVAQSCASTLTPCILELGGKSVVVVDETVPSKHLQCVANRIIFAKYFNAGQVCVAPDTLFIHESLVSKLTDALIEAMEEQFGKDPKQGELPRIVNQQNAQRLLEMIQQVEQTLPPQEEGQQQNSEKQQTRILIGGSKFCDVPNRYIAPTLALNPPKTCRLLTEEIFGPILPMIPFSAREEAIECTQRLGTTTGIPLFLYVFTPNEAIAQQYTDVCPSGGAVINDMVVQLVNSAQPFGGVGTSGHGSYFGKFSFDAFTHKFPITYRPLGSIWDFNNLRCHPYAGSWKALVMEKYAFKLPMVPAAISSPRGMALAMTSLLIIPVMAATLVATQSLMGGTAESSTGRFRLWLASALEGGAAYLRDM